MMNIHPRQLPPASDKRLPGVEIKPGPHNIIETIDGVKIQTNQKNYGYIPDMNNFKPKPGLHCEPVRVPQTKKTLMINEITDRRNPKDVLNEIIVFSKEEPKITYISKNIFLYKIVPKGGKIPYTSKYWITEPTLYKALESGDIEQKLGLPLASIAQEYEIYRIMPKPNALVNKITIFESEIAPTTEGAYDTAGGARQIIIPDMDKWTIPKKVHSFKLKK